MTQAPTTPTVADPLRAGGWGALLAAVAYLGQPVAVTLLYSDPSVDYQSIGYIAANPWNGAVEGAVFTGLATGFALLVVALARAGRDTVGTALTRALGLVSATAWLLVAGLSLGKYSSVATGTPETVPDPADQVAIVAGIDIAITGFVAAAALAAAGWLVGVASGGVVGRGLGVLCALAAAVIVVPMLVFAVPFGVLVLIPVLLVLGVAFLRRAGQRARRTG